MGVWRAFPPFLVRLVAVVVLGGMLVGVRSAAGGVVLVLVAGDVMLSVRLGYGGIEGWVK